jgi:Domain of unknown function (DUF6089)
MNLKALGLYIVCSLALVFTHANAQDEHLAEIGLAGGGAFYLGDANTKVFKNTQPAYGVLFRYRFNQRIAGRVEFSATRVNIPDALDPKDNHVTVPVDNPVKTLDVNFEFNFHDIAHNPFKYNTSRFTSYIFLGYSKVYFDYNLVGRVKDGINFGLGIKYKLGPRWNFNAQWANKLMLSDQIEGQATYADPFNMNGTNILNNDFLSTFSVAITYDFWERVCACRNITPKKPKDFKH